MGIYSIGVAIDIHGVSACYWHAGEVLWASKAFEKFIISETTTTSPKMIVASHVLTTEVEIWTESVAAHGQFGRVYTAIVPILKTIEVVVGIEIAVPV